MSAPDPKADSNLDIRNFGCRLNALDGDYVKAALDKARINDATVINSCAVTSEAVRQARQSIRKAAKDNPGTPGVCDRLRRPDTCREFCRHAGGHQGHRQ